MTTKKPGSTGIVIHRNVIERMLMSVKTFARERRTIVIAVMIGSLAATAVIVGAIIYVTEAVEKQRRELDRITVNVEQQMRSGDPQAVQKIIGDLRSLIDGNWFGSPRIHAYLLLGNIYYQEKKYKEAKDCLLIYARKSPSAFLSAMASLKAAVALEEMNDLDGALKIYDALEKSHADGAAADQVYYHQARVYAKKKDLFNARKYYSRVIASFPQSVLADKARKSIFLLGIQ